MSVPDIERVVRFYESIGPDGLAGRLAQVYAADASFKDPFQQVAGLAAIERIFAHMFEQVSEPHFVVGARAVNGRQAFLAWEFRFRMRRFSSELQVIRGASHLEYDEAGLVRMHRDYWDPAEELYEKIPVLGTCMRMLKKAAAR